MKNFKKIVVSVLVLASMTCSLSINQTSAEELQMSTFSQVNTSNFGQDDVGYKYNNEYMELRSKFETALEKNTLDITGVDWSEEDDTTTITFKDGSTYTIDSLCDDIIVSPQIQSEEEECYYILGYTISCAGRHPYIPDSNQSILMNDVSLPDGTTTDIASDVRWVDVELVYNLNGEYMGYRAVSSAEDGIKGDIVYTSDTDTTTTLGESDDDSLYSEPTNIRGDVNYDGLVNNVDVMLLRKYILHMIEW